MQVHGAAVSSFRVGSVTARSHSGPLTPEQDAELEKWSQKVMVPVSLKNLLETGTIFHVFLYIKLLHIHIHAYMNDMTI